MDEQQKCNLCEKIIPKYDAKYHHLIIDERHAVDICPVCIAAFAKWQGKQIAMLFPTKAVKKRYGTE